MFRFENLWLLNVCKVVMQRHPPQRLFWEGWFFMSDNMIIKMFKYCCTQWQTPPNYAKLHLNHTETDMCLAGRFR